MGVLGEALRRGGVDTCGIRADSGKVRKLSRRNQACCAEKSRRKVMGFTTNSTWRYREG